MTASGAGQGGAPLAASGPSPVSLAVARNSACGTRSSNCSLPGLQRTRRAWRGDSSADCPLSSDSAWPSQTMSALPLNGIWISEKSSNAGLRISASGP
ncbi:hypothetical protein D3C87_1264270 [compost metagenome]